MESLWQDLRYSLRLLLKNRGFTAVALMTLALGIGANSAIFSVVNAVVLRPLPYKDAEQLVVIWGSLNRPGMEEIVLSAPEFTDFKEQSRVFEQISAYSAQGFNLTGTDEPERIRGALVSASLFPLLGVKAALGRAFLPEEDQFGHEQVVILSHALWQRRFGADPALVGQTIMLDGNRVTVAGVMPAGFRFPEPETAVWKPLAFDPELLTENNRGSHFLDVIARLKAEVTLPQAQAEVNAITQRITAEHRQNYPKGFSASLRSLQQEVVGAVRPALLMLLGAVGLVLAIACANVANLLLARASSRQKEVAIRRAMGAGRFRLVRQFLTESLVLSLLGGVIGLLLALWSIEPLVSLIPSGTPRVAEIRLDRSVIGFTLAVSLLTGILFGLAPALQISKPNLNEVLKEGGRGASEGRRRLRLRSLLVISEVALALVLLLGAGLMMKSFLRLQEVKPGFDADHLLTMRLVLPQSKYPQFHQGQAFVQELFERLKAQGEVKSVGAINALPFSGSSGDRSFFIEGRPVPSGEPSPDEELRFISPGYLKTMGLPLLKGRDFTERDGPEAQPVAIINQALARKYWPNEEAIGKRLSFSRNEPKLYEIVGVVGNVKHGGLDAPEKPELYVPLFQPLFAGSRVAPMYLTLRTASDPMSLVATVRQEVRAIDRDQPLADIKTMEQRIAASVSPQRFNLLLLGVFATAALILAVVGIYGIMSYAVTERTHEIGIRLALGAQPRDILKLVVGQGMRLVLVGVLIGSLAAYGLTRWLSNLLYGVSPTDPTTYVLISFLLALVALLACYLPAYRAMKVDPITALRYE